MAVDQELLNILACPVCKVGVEVVALPDDLCQSLIEKYRPKFRDEEPVVRDGLKCSKCAKVYPVVSDIPVMLIEEALEL